MTITSEELDFIRDLVRSNTGVDLDATKTYLVESRLTPLLKEYGFSSLSDLIRQLKERPLVQLRQTVVNAMMTHETMFFRDNRPFECLRQYILPELIKKRYAERRLTIWNAACSSGQEPYSIAILIREHFPELLSWELKIMASDVSQTVLARAREGRYSIFEVSRGLPELLLKKYFEPSATHWTIGKEIRSMVTFFEHNLIRPFPSLPSFDIILIRNVLIYFNPEKKTEILTRVAKSLRIDGYLMLGGSETAVGLTTELKRVHLGESDCYRPRVQASALFGT